MSLALRPARSRGFADHGWLKSWHSFSFAEYHDPAHMGFRSLRVINDDLIGGGGGFPTHPHRDMEILTYVVSGRLDHADSTGGHALIGRGEIQHMSAGTGIRHSEYNASANEHVRLLQIWIRPDRPGLVPGHGVAAFPDAVKRGRLCPIVAADGRDGAVTLHQDVDIYASLLEPGQSVSHRLRPGRGAWLQVVDGTLTANGVVLTTGDGAAIEGEERLEIAAQTGTELLLFDLG